MSETAEQQRARLQKKRLMTVDDELVKCLDCGMKFVRVGSHVVQVHGYSNTDEYRKEHGLLHRQTTAPNYRNKMSGLIHPKSLANLKKGAHKRYVKGGDHPEKLKEFWDNWRKHGGKR